MKHAGSRAWPIAVILGLVLTPLVAEEKPEPSPWLGVRLSAKSEEGVTISRIFTGSPADKAGLRAQDVILDFDGVPVTGLRDLVGKIRAHEPGAWIPLTVERQGEELFLDVRLGDRPERVGRAEMRRGWIGVEAIDLPESLREHFGAPPEAGVMLSDVDAGSPAEAAGFRLGDVVYEIGGKPVGSTRAFRELIQGGGVGNDYEVLVARDGALLELEARIGTRPPAPEEEERDDE